MFVWIQAFTLLLWIINYNCSYKHWQNTLHLDSDMHYHVHILACTHTRIDIADETAQPRKNAMEDVTTASDQGPPATGCVARLMRRAWRWSFSVSFFTSILCKISLCWGIFPLWRMTLPFSGTVAFTWVQKELIVPKMHGFGLRRPETRERTATTRSIRVQSGTIGCVRIQTATASWATEVGYVLLVKTVPDNFQNNM